MYENETVIITGASRGIGRAIALNLSSKGFNIVINYRDSAIEAELLAEEIKENGKEVLVVQADISDFNEAEKLVKESVEKFGRVDYLINNAGITRDALVLRMKECDFDKVIDTNLKGTFNCIKHVSKVMIRQKSGKIINISSVIGITGNAGQANYAAAKAGVIGMTKSVAKELGSRNITVNAVAPGFIETDMIQGINEDIRKEYLRSIPLNRIGTADEVAEVVAFLLSSSADYITGQVIRIDGGLYI